MTVEIKGTHNYHVSDKTRDFIETKKMKKIRHFEEIIQDLHIILEKETNDNYKVDANIHLRWGSMSHISVTDPDLYKAIDELFSKVDLKISKEKEKKQAH